MNKIFICGDIHGSISPLKKFITRNGGVETFDKADKLILLGDVGINYFLDWRDKNAKNFLNKLPLKVYCVRGNHEERPSLLAKANSDKWDYFYDEELKGYLYREIKFSNIFYFDDKPSIYQIGNYKTLVMGGAYSVDKFYRLEHGRNWFENEQMSIEEMENATRICEDLDWKIDLVLTHTCPRRFEPTDLFLSVVDQNSVDNTMEIFFNRIEFQLDYKAWLWGHYHEFRDYPRLDKKRKTMLFNDNLIELNQYMIESVPNKF